MINWKTIPTPVLRSVSNEELIKVLSGDTAEIRKFSEFPSHSVTVERTVKLMAKASSKLIGPQSCDRFIRSTLKSRQPLLNFSTKPDFYNKFDTYSD